MEVSHPLESSRQQLTTKWTVRQELHDWIEGCDEKTP